jgi:hypothetical protein
MDYAVVLTVDEDDGSAATVRVYDAAFVDADSPHAGQEISRALDEGYAVVLVSVDGRERVITAKMLAASR